MKRKIPNSKKVPAWQNVRKQKRKYKVILENRNLKYYKNAS